MRYLIIRYTRQPSGEFKEQATVAETLKNHDLQMAAVILDYRAQAVVKAVIDGKTLPRVFQRFHTYYQEFFPAIVDRLEKENKSVVVPEPPVL